MNPNDMRSNILPDLKHLVQELGSSRALLQANLRQLQERVQRLQADLQAKELENTRLQEEIVRLSERQGIPSGSWLSRFSGWWKNLWGKASRLEKQIQQLETELTTQKELSAQANLSTQNLQNEVDALHVEKETLARKLETTTSYLHSEIQGLQNKIKTSDDELDVKKGLLLRYEQERAQLNKQLVLVQETSQYAILIDLIGQITPKRMAFLLENNENAQTDSEAELIKAARRLTSYLSQLNLRPVHRLGEHLRVSEDQLSNYQLDEEFSPDANFEVISPGFRIGGNLLVKPKIQSCEVEGGDYGR